MALIPEPHRVQVIWLAILGTLAIFLLGSAFVPVEGQVKGYCVLEPVRTWTLSERRVGSYESRTDDRSTGLIMGCRVHQFSRSTVLELGLDAQAGRDDYVAAGAVVAEMQSSDLDLEIAERSTAIEEARARLVSLQAGAKPAALRRAQLERERARAELEAITPRYERNQALYARGGISADEWETVETRRELLQLDLSLAEAQIEVLESGDSPEEVQAAEETLQALQAELDMVEAMRSAMVIRSPIAGRLRMNSGEGVLLSVSAVDSLVVSILLPQHRANELAPGQAIHTLIPGLGNEVFGGTLLRIEQQVLATERGPYIRAVGVIPDSDSRLEVGMQGRARISVGPSTALERMKRGIQAALFRELGP